MLKSKSIVIVGSIVIILAILFFCLFVTYKKMNTEKKNDSKVTDTVETNSDNNVESKEDIEKKKAYEDCMKKPYKMDSLEKEFNDLFESYEGRNLGIYFTDINNQYSFSLDPYRGYYSGCVVKIFATIYLVERARAGEIDLHDTLTYLPSDKHQFSDLTDQHEFYEEIPITTLMEYYMTISDNTAYFIIMRSFGSENINKYFKDKYDIDLPFTNSHPFISYYTAELGNKSLELLYNVLQVDDEYTELIKKSLYNEVENGLNFDNIKFMHKYGEYDVYHNDIGIYDSENPYLVTILTLYAYDDYIGKISSINKDMYTIYKKNLDSKKTYCENLSDIS